MQVVQHIITHAADTNQDNLKVIREMQRVVERMISLCSDEAQKKVHNEKLMSLLKEEYELMEKQLKKVCLKSIIINCWMQMINISIFPTNFFPNVDCLRGF